MKEGKTKAKRIQKIKMWQVSICIYPTFHIASGPCLLWRTLEACICYSYRTLSAWVQWKPSGSASQMGFKCMFASRLLSLGSFSHWLLRWRLLLFGKGLTHLLSREYDHSMVLKPSNVSSGGAQSSSENHRCVEAPGVPRCFNTNKHSRTSINPREVPGVKEMGETRETENWKKMAMHKKGL